ncbi:MAG TPA: hypothetical protein PKL69_07625 [Agitococcus sp.]|nr:hypothetical protein [Agitococcus sp.]HMY00805.1 hypothetical protein [Agitococcus sp.]HNJ86601.1 hypothetical protein [Agitococcus sp.]HNL80201.1 hypothetical protein [Agitococcus sp.]
MPNNLKLSNNVVNPQADALSDLADNGYLRIYDGTQPATADTAITTQVLLAELRFNATAAPAASNGVLTFNAITQDSSANNTGTASWFRALKSDGSTALFDGAVGTSGSDINIATTAIVAGAIVGVSSFVYTVNKG